MIDESPVVSVKPTASFWRGLRTSVIRALSLRNLVFYGSVVVAFSVLSLLLPYQRQVYLSIAAGFAVAILLPISMVLSRGLRVLDAIFIVGVSFLFLALFESDLPTRAVITSVRHISLFLSLGLTALYVALEALRFFPLKSHGSSVKSFSMFFSVCSTTLSSELCSCLHPALLLETFGITVFIENQVRLGFVIMMTTLLYQTRLTYEAYKAGR